MRHYHEIILPNVLPRWGRRGGEAPCHAPASASAAAVLREALLSEGEEEEAFGGLLGEAEEWGAGNRGRGEGVRHFPEEERASEKHERFLKGFALSLPVRRSIN